MDGRIRLISLRRGKNGSAVRTSPVTGVTTFVDNTTDLVIESHFSVDSVNSRHKDNELVIDHVGRLFVPWNQPTLVGSTLWEFSDWIPTPLRVTQTHGITIDDLIPSVGTVSTEVLARSNPSRPSLSIPNFLYELKDLPGMIRDIGRLKLLSKKHRQKGIRRFDSLNPKDYANHLLSYQMGWSPLIGDLRKLLDMQSQVDKKMRELQNLYSNGGLQRRIRSSKWRASEEVILASNAQLESSVSSAFRHNKIRYTTIERWGTVRWTPTALPSPNFSSKDMARLARDLAFGMHGISAKQVWDAIPWTWLVGWFSNADEFIQAHHNTIPLTHSVPCIMTRTTSKISFIRTDAFQQILPGGYGDVGLDSKRRVMNGGTLSATIPFLNGRQLSILGALAIQRKR